MKSGDGLIRLSGVHRTFIVGEIDVHVLRGIDLTVNSRELLVIHGESGSGKSTLMNIIGGIDRPTRGTLSFKDRFLNGCSDQELTRFRRDHVGFVFQFYNLIPSLTALENVATATEIAVNPMNPGEALEIVGLGDRADYFPSQLSGGQQQRVAMARALAKQPELMLCDEPTGALDQENSILILELLQRINRETGTTIVMISHAHTMARMANRTATIADGIINKITINQDPLPASKIAW